MTIDPPTPARRLAAPRWFDPRIIFGVGLIVVPIVVGAHLLAAADRYASVYVAHRALVPGERLEADDVVVGRVRFDGQGDQYIAAGQPPIGYLVTRYVAAGELLPLNALSGAANAIAAGRLITIPVGIGHAPLDLARGDVVDVYVTAKSASGDKAQRPRLVVGAAPVDAVSGSGALSSSGSLSVVVAVPAVAVAAIIDAIENGAIDVVRLPDAEVSGLGTPRATTSPAPSASPQAGAAR